ncbi:MAG: hypothetical protein HWN67_09930 [Candidatus Helarchaeota archaeon]|nr:hypothetical protein [Candidatus Helarchaeota archaeon]
MKRKCVRQMMDLLEIHPAYTSLIGKYSRLHNLSGHVLANYVIARRGLGFEGDLPAIYEWLLLQVNL